MENSVWLSPRGLKGKWGTRNKRRGIYCDLLDSTTNFFLKLPLLRGVYWQDIGMKDMENLGGRGGAEPNRVVLLCVNPKATPGQSRNPQSPICTRKCLSPPAPPAPPICSFRECWAGLHAEGAAGTKWTPPCGHGPGPGACISLSVTAV